MAADGFTRAGNSARPLAGFPPFPLHFPRQNRAKTGPKPAKSNTKPVEIVGIRLMKLHIISTMHRTYVLLDEQNSPFPRFFSRKSYQWRLRFAYTAGDEGAAARLAWNRMPRKPCTARLPGSGARTFAPLCGAKVTAFLSVPIQPGRGKRHLLVIVVRGQHIKVLYRIFAASGVHPLLPGLKRAACYFYSRCREASGG